MQLTELKNKHIIEKDIEHIYNYFDNNSAQIALNSIDFLMDIKRKIFNNTAISALSKLITMLVSLFMYLLWLRKWALTNLDYYHIYKYSQLLDFFLWQKLTTIEHSKVCFREHKFKKDKAVLHIVSTSFVILLIMSILVVSLGSFQIIVSYLNIPIDNRSTSLRVKNDCFNINFHPTNDIFTNYLEGLQKYFQLKITESLFWTSFMLRVSI